MNISKNIMRKEEQIRIGSTNDITNLYYHNPTDVLRYDDKASVLSGVNTFCYLYVINTDEVKKDDYLFYNNSLYQCIGFDIHGFIMIYEDMSVHKSLVKKVTASTNPNLWVNKRQLYKKDALPTLSKEFVELYVKHYNDDKKIETVMVPYDEFNWHYPANSPDEGQFDYKLKVDSDNVVNVTYVKDTFTRKEIEPMLKFLKDFADGVVVDRTYAHKKATEFLTQFDK